MYNPGYLSIRCWRVECQFQLSEEILWKMSPDSGTTMIKQGAKTKLAANPLLRSTGWTKMDIDVRGLHPVAQQDLLFQAAKYSWSNTTWRDTPHRSRTAGDNADDVCVCVCDLALKIHRDVVKTSSNSNLKEHLESIWNHLKSFFVFVVHRGSWAAFALFSTLGLNSRYLLLIQCRVLCEYALDSVIYCIPLFLLNSAHVLQNALLGLSMHLSYWNRLGLNVNFIWNDSASNWYWETFVDSWLLQGPSLGHMNFMSGSFSTWMSCLQLPIRINLWSFRRNSELRALCSPASVPRPPVAPSPSRAPHFLVSTAIATSSRKGFESFGGAMELPCSVSLHVSWNSLKTSVEIPCFQPVAR